MKNLEQIRARNAYKAATDRQKNISGKQGGEVIKKIPPMILNHGLLGTTAYGYDNRGWKDSFNAMAEHLADPLVGLLPKENASHEGLIRYLTREEATSQELKRITAEALAWLNYARRFVGKLENAR